MRFDDIEKMIGCTPIIRVHAEDVGSCRLWLKLEGYNPSGSVKDRACISNIRDAEEAGKLRPGMTLLDASSGNMACALAMFGHLLDYKVVVVCSSKLTKDKENFIRYFGGDLEQVGDFTIEGNHYCRDHIQPRDPEKYCFLDQLHNWANPRASYLTLGPEILKDIPEVSAVVASLGSGGSLLGTGSYIKEHKPDVQVVAVQSATGTRIPGTGSFDDGDYITPFIKKGYEETIYDHTVKITISDAFQSTSELAKQGIFVGHQTGGVYSAARRAIKEYNLSGDIVMISGDSGWKNMERLLAE